MIIKYKKNKKNTHFIEKLFEISLKMFQSCEFEFIVDIYF